MRSLFALLAATAALACCLHDRDTPAAERAARPGVFEAIFGFVPIRTREFYERRIEQVTTERGERPLTPALYDDLAVARARLGDLAEAERLLREKAERYPGLYTTQANLGTLQAWRETWGAAAETLQRAVDAEPDRPGSLVRYQLQAMRFFAAGGLERTPEQMPTMLGYDLADRLGERFRLDAPRTTRSDERPLLPRSILDRLGLEDDVIESLALLLTGPEREQAEYAFVLAELLAAEGDRYLAWHAYQRAYELEHPRSTDIPYYQAQVAEALDRDARGRLRPIEHWRLRERALRWQRDYQTWERARLAAGDDPTDAALLAAFYEEHPPR